MQPVQLLMAIQKKRNKNEAGSSNNEVTNAISAPAKEQNNEVMHLDMAQQEEAFSPGALERWMDSIADQEIESMLGRSSPEELLHDALETVPRTEMVQHLERGSSHERTSINQAGELQGDSSEPTDLLCPTVLRVLEQSNAVHDCLAGDAGVTFKALGLDVYPAYYSSPVEGYLI